MISRNGFELLDIGKDGFQILFELGLFFGFQAEARELRNLFNFKRHAWNRSTPQFPLSTHQEKQNPPLALKNFSHTLRRSVAMDSARAKGASPGVPRRSCNKKRFRRRPALPLRRIAQALLESSAIRASGRGEILFRKRKFLSPGAIRADLLLQLLRGREGENPAGQSEMKDRAGPRLGLV